MRVIVKIEIDTNEHPDEVLERVSNAMEVARYRMCHGSAIRKEDAVDDQIARDLVEANYEMGSEIVRLRAALARAREIAGGGSPEGADNE